MPLPIAIFCTLNDYRIKYRIIGQNCEIILISDMISATLATDDKCQNNVVERQLSIVTTRKNRKNRFTN
jgi:hypothetical protein